MGKDEGDEGEEETLDETSSFDDAERVVMVGEDGTEQTYVVLAVLDVDGTDYAMLASEGELAEDAGDMTVFLFEYGEDDDGRPVLSEIDDDDRYDEVYRMCASLVDLKPGDVVDEPDDA
jgi:uncharacterized protein YrzB (UPF0473 family)